MDVVLFGMVVVLAFYQMTSMELERAARVEGAKPPPTLHQLLSAST